MTPEQYQELSRHFAALCDLPPEAQREGLAAVADPVVRDELAGLLRADAEDSPSLGQAPTGLGALAIGRALLTEDVDPTEIGPYRVIGRLGVGGMGVVYEAEQAEPRRRVAIKVLHPWLRTPTVVERFRFEAQALAVLLHPGIPQVYEVREDAGTACLVMELVRGRPLLEHVGRARLDTTARLRLLAQVCDAVQHAHDNGILHLDLKPENVLVGRDGRPKVLDFGISRQIEGGDRGIQGAGTAAFMSPEQREGRPLDARADVFALGVMALEVLGGGDGGQGSGGISLDDGVSKHTPRSPGRVPADAAAREPAVLAGASRDVALLVARARCPNPADRTPSAAALADDLRRAAADLPLPWRRGGVGYRASLFLKRHRRAAAAVGVAAVAALAVGGALASLDAQSRARLERVATSRMEIADARSADALARGDRAQADREVRDFVSSREFVATRAVSVAWRRHAQRLLPFDADGSVDAASRALLAARAPDDAERALQHLARGLFRAARWGALGRTLRALGPSGRAGLGADLTAMATACGAIDLVDPARATPAEHRVIDALRRGIPAPAGASLLATPRPGAKGWIIADTPEAVTVWRLEGDWVKHAELPPRASLDLHGPDPIFAVGGGRLLIAMSVARSSEARGRVRSFEADFDASSWAMRADLPATHPTTLAVIELPSGPRALLSVDYPNWGFYGFDLEGGELAVAEPTTHAIGATTTSIAPIPGSDGDARAVLLGQAGWRFGYQVRVLGIERDGTLGTLAARVVGPVTGVAAVPETGPATAILAVAGPMMLARDVEPSDRAARLVRLRLDGSELTEEGERALPWTTPNDARFEMGEVLLADLDGGGAPAAVVQAGSSSWILPNAADPSTSDLVLGDVRVLGVADLDGDGDDELLVSMGPTRSPWILGLGDAAPPLSRDADGPDFELGPAPSADAAARDAWTRAATLLDLGLAREAAEGLAALAEVQITEVRTAFRAASGRILAAIDAPGAGAQLARALESAPTDAQVAAELLPRAARALDFDTARAAAQALPPAERPAWLAGAFTRAPDEITVRGPIDPRWRVDSPGALTVGPDGAWHLSVDAGRGTLLSTAVELDGDGFALELALDIERAEFATHLAIDLVPEDGGPAVARASMFTHGGGGFTGLTASCPSNPWALTTPQTDRDLAGRLTLRIAHRSDATVCAPSFEDESGRVVSPPEVPAAGRYRLRLRTSEDRSASRRIALDLVSLRVWGGRWVAPAEPPTAGERARALLAVGRSAEALALVPPDAPTALWAWMAEGASDELDAIVAAFLARGDLDALVTPLRTAPGLLGPPLAARLGDAYPALHARAFELPLRYHPDAPDIIAVLLDPSLDRSGRVGPEARAFGALRAGQLLERGELARARREAQRVLEGAPDGTIPDRPGHRAALVLARTLQRLGAPGVDRALADAERLASSPEEHVYLRERAFSR